MGDAGRIYLERRPTGLDSAASSAVHRTCASLHEMNAMVVSSRTIALLAAQLLYGCSRDSPTAIEPPADVAFAAVTAGGDHTCGLTNQNAAFCWGSNTRAQLGNGTADPTAQSAPVSAAGSLRFVALNAGGIHTCGLTDRRIAYCWGDDSAGQLGGGAPSPAGSSAVPVSVAGGIAFKALTLGGRHTCGLDADGQAFCWGDNRFGQLGNGSSESSAEPVQVIGGLNFSSLEAGVIHTCGLTASGTAFCWGYNRWGQIGVQAPEEKCGVSPCASTPARITGAPPLVSLVAGGLQNCGLTESGIAYCWGANLAEELGNAAVPGSSSAVPVEVLASARFTSVTVGEHGSCALTSGGAAYCWGSNSHGQLGNGTPVADVASSPPVRVSGELRFAAVSSGMFHTCGTTLRGTIYCWGANRSGQLGTGTTKQSSKPVPVARPLAVDD